MLRLFAVFGLVALLPLPGEAGEPGDHDDSPCNTPGRIKLALTADEFTMTAYDAARGLVLVRPQSELLPGVDRSYSVKLRFAEPEVLMPLGPNGLFFGLESGSAELELVVVAKPVSPECDAEARPACDELEALALYLKRGDMVISSRRLREPVEPVVRFETRVFGRVQIERGEVDADAVAEVGQTLGEACLRRGLRRTRMIQGSLRVQLATTVLGKPEPPEIKVDSLVDAEVTRCLLDGLARSEALWPLLPAASRVYLMLYFRGEAISETPTLAIEPNPSL